jgi:hypothetical protein
MCEIIGPRIGTPDAEYPVIATSTRNTMRCAMAEDNKQPVQNKNVKSTKNTNIKPDASQKKDQNLDQNFDRDNKMGRDQER